MLGFAFVQNWCGPGRAFSNQYSRSTSGITSAGLSTAGRLMISAALTWSTDVQGVCAGFAW